MSKSVMPSGYFSHSRPKTNSPFSKRYIPVASTIESAFFLGEADVFNEVFRTYAKAT